MQGNDKNGFSHIKGSQLPMNKMTKYTLDHTEGILCKK